MHNSPEIVSIVPFSSHCVFDYVHRFIQMTLFTKELWNTSILHFIALNVTTLVFGTIVECFNERSIFKPATRKNNEKYWKRRVNEAIKAYVYSIYTFVVSALFGALWDLHYGDIFYGDTEFHFGRFLILTVIYWIMFDAYLYWYHRLLHIRTPINLYKHIHLYHHQFKIVTSYASGANHPIESVIAASNHFVPGNVMAWIFPFDALSHQNAGFLMVLYALVLHDEDWGAVHIYHHHYVNFNFGAWSVFWDKMCNTYKNPAGRKSRTPRAKRTEVRGNDRWAWGAFPKVKLG